VKLLTLTTSKESEKTKSHPSAANIRTELKALAKRATGNDDVVVYFSGHAVQFRGKNPGPFLCPLDASLRDRSSLLALSEVVDSLKKSKARNILLVLDIGRTDPTASLSRSASFLADIASVTRPTTPRRGNFAVFVACRRGQVAYETEKLKSGVFTYFLTQGWNGKADIDGDRCITLTELSFFVSKAVEKHVRDELSTHQTPEVSGVFAPTWCLRELPVENKKDAK
jgi:uncharacterized caspase-like protein